MKYYLRRHGEDRRFVAGYEARVSGVPFRVERGRKAEGDLVLLWLTDSGWVPVDMAAGALLTDFFYENEHHLYPPPKDGGEKYMRFMRDAVQLGWKRAVAKLEAEKAAARLRRRQDGAA